MGTKIVENPARPAVEISPLEGFKQEIQRQFLVGQIGTETTAIIGVRIADNAKLRRYLWETIGIEVERTVDSLRRYVPPYKRRHGVANFSHRTGRTAETTQRNNISSGQVGHPVDVPAYVAENIPVEPVLVQQVKTQFQFQPFVCHRTGIGVFRGVPRRAGRSHVEQQVGYLILVIRKASR